MLGMFKAEEKPEYVHKLFKELADKIDQLNDIKLSNGKTYQIEK